MKQCWATTLENVRCQHTYDPATNPIPYCPYHMEHGDEAVQVVEHPVAGKILVARFPIEKGYHLVYWGDRIRRTYQSEKNDDRQIDFLLNDTTEYGVIDPLHHPGCVLQFAASPGPQEHWTLHTTSYHFGDRKSKLAGRMYNITRDIPANMQIAHHYGAGWFSERGMKRVNVGTEAYPLPRREKKRNEFRKEVCTIFRLSNFFFF